MDVHPATPLIAGALAPMGGYRNGLPSLAQPGFLTPDPFDDYLVSIHNPAAIARVAIARLATPSAAAGDMAASLTPTPAVPGGETPDAAAAMASTPVDFAQEYPDSSAPEGATAREPEPPATGAAPPANAASLATNALFEADAASQLAQGSGRLATDAAARFMGAGQQSGLALDQTAGLATYGEALKAIPAINGLASSAGLAANTSSPQNRPFSPIAPHPAPAAPPLQPVSGAPLDLIA